MPVPLKTLPGYVPAPIEPGWRCESEPCVSGPPEVVALDRAGEALALADAGDIDDFTLGEQADVDDLADLVAATSSTRNSRVSRCWAGSSADRHAAWSAS
jgi:hypothetical protein